MAPSQTSHDPYAADPIDASYYQPAPKPLPTDPTTRRFVQSVLKNGYVIIPNAFTAAEAIEAKLEIQRLHGTSPLTGHNDFDGHKTNRIHAILGKTRVFDKFCLLPQVHALNAFFLDPDYLFYIIETITINPGEKAQVLHHDDAPTRLPRPRKALTAATMIVLDDYTELNGATRLVPGSHLWGPERLPREEEAVSAICPRGSVIYFLGTTWHSGGANRSGEARYAATIQYCQPWMRPVENLMVAVDPRRALDGEIPGRIADMMGYRSAVPFVGYADGMNPRKATSRMIRWLQEPVKQEQPTFASEKGGKERAKL